jgi:hypothetical protein
LAKDLISGKLTHDTEDQQIDARLSAKPYDFYKQIDINNFHKYLVEKYHEHTGNSYRNYFEKYASLFFGPNPDVELFKFKPHKRSWILQAIKRFGDYYFRKYNNTEK